MERARGDGGGAARAVSATFHSPDALAPGVTITLGEDAAHHARVREELPVRGLALSRSDPAIPTVYTDADPGR